jgi:hypothetical protein
MIRINNLRTQNIIIKKKGREFQNSNLMTQRLRKVFNIYIYIIYINCFNRQYHNNS